MFTRSFCLSVLIAACSLPSIPAIADEGFPILAFAENLSEEDYLGEVPRVLTVSRLSQTIADLPSAVTVLDRDTIRASGAVDLPEILRLVPGMYVGANAGYVYNTNHAVSYHGMNTAYPGQMQVLINGRSVYTPLFGGVKWSELPVALIDIERIEVTRGPNAASYGANAFAATINIITQSPGEVTGNALLATHGNGRNEAFYRHAGKSGDLAYRATLGYRQDDGWDNRNDFKRTRFFNAQADYQLNLANNIEFEMGIAAGDRGEGNINEDNLIFLPRTRGMNNYHGLVRWRHHISDTSDFQLQAYHSRDNSDDETISVDLRPTLSAINPLLGATLINNVLHINNDVETTRSDIEAQHTFTLGDSIRAVWGGSMRRDTMYAPYFLGTRKTDKFDLQRLFGHVEWSPHRMWTVNLGSMIEHNDFTGTDSSPRASLNFKPSANHAFRLGISSALRTPNYVEEKFDRKFVLNTSLPAPFSRLLFLSTLANGNLDPEKIVSKELGYIGKFGSLSWDTRIFADRISRVIRPIESVVALPPNTTLLNPDDENTFVNSGDAEVAGIELSARWQLADSTSLLLNHAHINIRETRPNLKNNFVESMPSNSISALLTHRFNDKWDASLSYFQTSYTNMLGDGNEVDLIRRADVRLARKFMTGGVNGEVSAVIENLFNTRYEEFADYNQAERRARINLRLDF